MAFLHILSGLDVYKRQLKDRQLDAGKLLFKPETIPEEVMKYRPPVNLPELLEGITLTRLNDIFQTVLRRCLLYTSRCV